MNLYSKLGLKIVDASSITYLDNQVPNEKQAGLPMDDRVTMVLDLKQD